MPEERRGADDYRRGDDRKARDKKVESRDRDRDRDRDRRDRDSDKRKDRKSSKDENHRSSRKDRSSKEGKEVEEHVEPEEAPKEHESKLSAAKEATVVEGKPNESTEALQERIAKMRDARRSKKTEDDDVTAWVNKSRMLEKQKKLQKAVPPMAKLIAEQEEDEDEGEEPAYSSKELAGMKVRHGLDQVMQGGEVILTLKDSRIIMGEELNEEADELENVTIAEQKARKDAYQASKKKNALDEDKFQNDINTVTSILPQYGDESKEESVVLDDTGGIKEDAQAKVEEVRKKLLGLQSAMKVDSLQSKASVAKDFYTTEEMLQFKKPKAKTKKKLRKKDKLDLDAIEAEAKASGLGADDLGSRDVVLKAKEKQVEAKMLSRMEAYDIAYAKAREASKVPRPDAADANTVMEDEDEFQLAMKRTREEALKKRTVLGPQGVAAMVASLNEEPENMNVDGEERTTISETQEFCLSLQLDAALRRRTADEDDDDKPADEEVADKGDAEGAGWMEVADNDDVAKVDKPIDELPIREVTAGKGLAATLQLLQEKGSLKNGVEWGGRNMDKKASKLIGIVDDKEADRDVLLDRRDEYGRSMTPKESFRRLSHKFHGKGPGKTKQEKKMKQYEEEQKLKHMDPGSATEKMREIQQQTHTPYIVVTGHIKPGQTSDPRSGFATVEKESSIGGLTPMLGDRKVEHFLGINKRKSDMKPPRPKRIRS